MIKLKNLILEMSLGDAYKKVYDMLITKEGARRFSNVIPYGNIAVKASVDDMLSGMIEDEENIPSLGESFYRYIHQKFNEYIIKNDPNQNRHRDVLKKNGFGQKEYEAAIHSEAKKYPQISISKKNDFIWIDIDNKKQLQKIADYTNNSLKMNFSPNQFKGKEIDKIIPAIKSALENHPNKEEIRNTINRMNNKSEETHKLYFNFDYSNEFQFKKYLENAFKLIDKYSRDTLVIKEGKFPEFDSNRDFEKLIIYMSNDGVDIVNKIENEFKSIGMETYHSVDSKKTNWDNDGSGNSSGQIRGYVFVIEFMITLSGGVSEFAKILLNPKYKDITDNIISTIPKLPKNVFEYGRLKDLFNTLKTPQKLQTPQGRPGLPPNRRPGLPPNRKPNLPPGLSIDKRITLIDAGTQQKIGGCGVSTTFGKRQLNSKIRDANFYNNEQFKLEKTKNGWWVYHNSEATNQTLFKPVEGEWKAIPHSGIPVQDNILIAVGNIQKSIFKGPIKLTAE
jgi:hypothetical protein